MPLYPKDTSPLDCKHVEEDMVDAAVQVGGGEQSPDLAVQDRIGVHHAEVQYPAADLRAGGRDEEVDDDVGDDDDGRDADRVHPRATIVAGLSAGLAGCVISMLPAHWIPAFILVDGGARHASPAPPDRSTAR